MARQQSGTRQAKNSRQNMLYCENCGEYYSDTYRRCPFCDERPGRRIDEHARKARNPLQLVVLVGTLILIIAAFFIVFTKLAPLFTDSEEPVAPETSQTQPEQTPQAGESQPQPEAQPQPAPETSVVRAQAIVLSKTDFTLKPGETYTVTATVAPVNATEEVVWTSSHPDILSVDKGTVVNNNTSPEKVVVTLTATCGGVSADCVVRCNTSSTGGSTSSDTPSNPSTSVSISGKTRGVVTGAGSGLNIRSGPGSNYEKIASASNGAEVTVLENAGDGWYKIDYGGGRAGYASSDFIQIK